MVKVTLALALLGCLALGCSGGGASGGGARNATGGATNEKGGAGTGGATSATGGAGGGGQPGHGGALAGLGRFDGLEAGPPSHGGTLTFENIGAVGSYPSLCAPAASGMCCRATHTLATDQLTPWNEELIMTLRGPMVVKQLAVYQPQDGAGAGSTSASWRLVSAWDARTPASARGVAFTGEATPKATFNGKVGSVCLVNVSTDQAFPCGPGSSPYCAANSPNHDRGWSGSKLFVLLASMPHVDSGGIAAADGCAAASNGWTDAPWIGLSVGELVRAGAFSTCQCYEVTQYHGDGCGQFNAFEVINDNDTSGNYKNLEIFSSNFFGYGGDFGGPCGTNVCSTAGLTPAVDLVAKSSPQGSEASQGGLASQTPRKSPSVFLRRPTAGFRYFLLLLDVDTRTVQLAVIHPDEVPAALAPLLPSLPAEVDRAAIEGLRGLRLPR